MVTTGVSASSRALRQVSSSAAAFLRRVMPKAATLACFSGELADRLEVLEVLGVRERVAALDEVDAQLVEPAGDEQLVLEREVDALALAAVAEGGVVDRRRGSWRHPRCERKSPEAIAPGPGRFGRWTRQPRATRVKPTTTRRTPCAAVIDDRQGRGGVGHGVHARRVPGVTGIYGADGPEVNPVRAAQANRASTVRRQPGTAGSASAVSPAAEDDRDGRGRRPGSRSSPVSAERDRRPRRRGCRRRSSRPASPAHVAVARRGLVVVLAPDFDRERRRSPSMKPHRSAATARGSRTRPAQNDSPAARQSVSDAYPTLVAERLAVTAAAASAYSSSAASDLASATRPGRCARSAGTRTILPSDAVRPSPSTSHQVVERGGRRRCTRHRPRTCRRRIIAVAGHAVRAPRGWPTCRCPSARRRASGSRCGSGCRATPRAAGPRRSSAGRRSAGSAAPSRPGASNSRRST